MQNLLQRDLGSSLLSLAIILGWLGLFFVRQFYRLKPSPFLKWRWTAFFILMIWFVSQNIYVEAYFYPMQLGSNGDLSWAPLQPLGSWYNPVLFKISGNPITFQSQSSWVIMTPIVYCLSIYFYKNPP